MAWLCLFIILPGPAISAAQSFYQGMILNSRRTRSIPESVGLFLVVVTLALVAGVLWGAVTGLYFTLASFTFGEFVRTFWLWQRSRDTRRRLRDLQTEAV
jgi:hypothetical protein